MEATMAVRIEDETPRFTAGTTEGKADFHQSIGDKQAALLSSPKSFTRVCMTERGYIAPERVGSPAPFIHMTEALMRRMTKILAILAVGTAAVVAAGCKTPPTQEQMAAYNYGPRPDDYQKLIRDYLWPKLLDPGNAIIEFKAGPRELFQQETALRPLEYGWGVCVWITDKTTSGKYDTPFPMVFFIRNGKIVKANGGGDDNIIGWRYARTGCNELGAPFVAR
jgi:hypothetical protein